MDLKDTMTGEVYEMYLEEIINEIKKEIRNSEEMVIRIYSGDFTEEICDKIKNMEGIKCGIVSIDDPGNHKTVIPKGKSIIGIHKMVFPDIDIYDAPHLMKYAAIAKDLEGLKDFIDKIKNDCNFLIIHCVAGISRSPAVASAIEEYLKLPDSVWHIGNYIPNRHVYRLALEEFGIHKAENKIDEKYQILFNNKKESEE